MHRGTCTILLLAWAVVWGPADLAAQTKYPGADSVFPLAVTRGVSTEVEVRFNGNVQTAYLALVEGGEADVKNVKSGAVSDIRAEIVPRSEKRKIANDRAIVRITPTATARVGPRDLRIVTREAITTLVRIYVTDLPAQMETSAHATREKSQPIPIPSVTSGRIAGAVETDWYRFQASKGERVNFEVLGTRLHETIHKIGRFTPHFDPYLSIRDREGRELAAADDHYFADSFLSFVIPADGEYHVVVREANYKGHASYTYALVATRGPCPLLTFPMAVAPGKSAAVNLIGPGCEAAATGTVSVDAGAVLGLPYLARPRYAAGPGDPSEPGDAQKEARELLVLPSALPVVLETEGVEISDNDAFAGAQAITLPAGVAGRIGRPDDVDHFAFDAEAGRTYRIEVLARRLFSTIDSEVQILDRKGRVLKSADDVQDAAGRRSRDSRLDWKAPSDGRYIIQVRDLHARGGREFVYHLECEEARADFELTFDPELAMVAAGNRTPVYVRAHRRHGFSGQIDLAVEGLPAGVEAFIPPIRAGMDDACVVFSVADDAKPGGANFRVRGRAEIRDAAGKIQNTVVRSARPLVEIYQAQRVIGRTAALAVTERSDIAVTTKVSEVTLRPGETQVIPVKLIRDPKYKSGSVSLWASWRFRGRVFGNSLPPGVTVDDKKSRLGIIGSNVDGAVALKAAANAKPIAQVPTVVIGLIPIEFSVFVPFCTRPILVSVTEINGKSGKKRKNGKKVATKE